MGKYTSAAEERDGWSDSDWGSTTWAHSDLCPRHYGGDSDCAKLPGCRQVFKWRMQLSRRLTSGEHAHLARMDIDEITWDDEKKQYDMDKMVALIKDVAPDVEVVRHREGWY